MIKSDKGKKVLGLIVILAIIVSVFGGAVSAEDVSGGLKQSVDDAEIQTAVGNLSSVELTGEQINKSDNVTTEQLRFNPGYRAPYQCGSEGACSNCGEVNPCLCCDNDCDSPADWHDGCDGNCVWWAWDRACCLWGVGLDFHPNGGEWAEAARSHEPSYRVSDTPEVGTIADGRSLRHVAWVVGVSEDKLTITVSEMMCGEFCGDCSNPNGQSTSVRIYPRPASAFEYIYPLTITAQSIYSSPASPGDELTFVYRIKNPSDRAMSNIRLGARIRTNSPQGSWIDDPANDKVISVDPGEKDYSRNFRISSDVSSGYYDAGWVIVNQNTDEYQVTEAWVDENVMNGILYIETIPQMIYLDNGIIRVGVNLDWGGAISEISHQGFNLIDDHDTGRLAQVAFYNDDSGTWDPVQGGDVFNQGSPVLDYNKGANLIYTKTQPRDWKTGVLTDTYVEQWVSLEGESVKVQYKFTHFGTDTYTFHDQEFPCAYINTQLYRLITYTNSNPWTNEGVNEFSIPQTDSGTPNTEFYPTEYWASFVNDLDFGLTLYSPDHTSKWAAHRFTCDTKPSYLATVDQFAIGPGTVEEATEYFIVGNYPDARNKIYSLEPGGCEGTDTSCGIYPNCENCNDRDGWYCNGDIREYRDFYCSGISCTYTVTSSDNCNNYDGWVDTGNTKWVDVNDCQEKEQKEQKYRDYYCLGGACTYNVTDTQWVDTGNTRNKPDGTICGCTASNTLKRCYSGVCTDTGICDSSICDADAACDGKEPGDSCGGGICDSNCKCGGQAVGDDIAVYIGRTFYISTNLGASGEKGVDLWYNFGLDGAKPLVGDFNRDGHDDIAVYIGRTFYISTTLGASGEKGVDLWYNFGLDGAKPLVGDFNHDGYDDIAVYIDRTFYISTTLGTSGEKGVDLWYNFGLDGAKPLVGDFNHDGRDDIAVYIDRTFYISTNLGTSGEKGVDLWYNFGLDGAKPLVGDFDQDGYDDIAVYIDRTFYISTNLGTSGEKGVDLWYNFGLDGAKPLVGDFG